MHIDRDIEERIKAAARIADVAGDYMQLRKRGRNWLGLCPFHDDRHVGSFVIDEKTNSFRCYACGAHGDPIEFVKRMEHAGYPDALAILARKYCIDIPGRDNHEPPVRNTPRPIQRAEPKAAPMLELPIDYVTSRMDTHADILCNWMRGLGWSDAQRGRLEHTLQLYGVGHARQGHTIFWQIDELLKVRTGKMMLYRANGHRDRETPGNFHWIHNLLAHAGKVDLQKAEYRTTLFGMHLLNQDSTKVCIVESEKTALLAAIYFGRTEDAVWMASGGLTMLTPQRLEPLLKSGKDIVLYPDKDGQQKWMEQARRFDNGHVSLNTFYLDKYWDESDGPKADLGDIIVKMVGREKSEPRVDTGTPRAGTTKSGQKSQPADSEPEPNPVEQRLLKTEFGKASLSRLDELEERNAAAIALGDIVKRNKAVGTLVEKLGLGPASVSVMV